MGSVESETSIRGNSANRAAVSKVVAYIGEVEILQDQEKNSRIMKKRVNISNFSEIKLQAVDVLVNTCHSNILELIDVQQVAENDYEVYFEDFLYTLEDEIHLRGETGMCFTNQEIFAILRQITSALACLQEKGIPHGGIMTSAILKLHSNEYKIIHPLLIGRSLHRESLDKDSQQSDLLRFVPETPESKLQGDVSDLFRDDIYGIGIALIDACLLGRTELALKKRKALVRKRYSPVVVGLLEKMLESRESERLDSLVLNYIINEEDVVNRIDRPRSHKKEPQEDLFIVSAHVQWNEIIC